MQKLKFIFHHATGPETFAYITQGKTVLGAGVAIKNPEDSFDAQLAEKTAMRRACQAAAVKLHLVNGDSAKKTIQQIERDLYHDWRKRAWEANHPEEVMEVKRLLEPLIPPGSANNTMWAELADVLRNFANLFQPKAD